MIILYFIEEYIANKKDVLEVFAEYTPNVVISLAAQAAVRYSIENPNAYINSNILGFYNILEACRHYSVEHLLYASSSLVYGANKKVSFEETDFVDRPVSLYASTKKSNELMAHTYCHLYNISATGLRFLQFMDQWGVRIWHILVLQIIFFNNEPIKIFNNGDFENDFYRDFTYIDDIVEGMERLLHEAPEVEDGAAHRVMYIGNNNPEKLMDFIHALEDALSNKLGRKPEFEKIYGPIKPGDVPATYASTERVQQAIGFKAKLSIQEGLQKFVDWYVDYYELNGLYTECGGPS